MLKWIIIGIFGALGKCLMYLVYGNQGMEARKKLGYSNNGTAILLSIALACEVFIGGFYLTVTPAEDIGIGNILLLLVVPVAILIWIIAARAKLPKLLRWAAAGPDDAVDSEEPLPIPEGGWRCSCGKVHAAYVSSCVCGVNKRDIPRNP